jgi:hypothetical protein
VVTFPLAIHATEREGERGESLDRNFLAAVGANAKLAVFDSLQRLIDGPELVLRSLDEACMGLDLRSRVGDIHVVGGRRFSFELLITA